MDGEPGGGWGLDRNRGHGKLPRCTSISWPPLRWPHSLSPDVPENQAPRDLPAGQRHRRATARWQAGAGGPQPGEERARLSLQLADRHSRQFEASCRLGKVTGRQAGLPEDAVPEFRLAQTHQSPHHSEFLAGSLGLARAPPSAGACEKGTEDSSPPRMGPPSPRTRNKLRPCSFSRGRFLPAADMGRRRSPEEGNREPRQAAAPTQASGLPSLGEDACPSPEGL